MQAVVEATCFFSAYVTDYLRSANLGPGSNEALVDAAITDAWMQFSSLRATGTSVLRAITKHSEDTDVPFEAAFAEWTQFVNAHVSKRIVRALLRHVFVNVDGEALAPAPVGVM